jgi:hypothetical protein
MGCNAREKNKHEFFVHYALRVEQFINMVLMRNLWNFSSFGRGDVSPTHSELCRVCFGVIGKTPGIISRNNFVKKIFSTSAIATMSWQDVTRSFLCSDVKECGTKRARSFPNPLSESEELHSWDVQRFCYHSLCDSTFIFDHISNSSNFYLSSSRFWTATSLVIFYQVPSVSKSRIPPKNVWSVQSLIPINLLHQY